MIKVGVIGLGKISQTQYLPSLLKIDNALITKICDYSPTISQELCKQYGLSTEVVARTVDEVISSRPDVVFVLTHNHYNTIKKLLNAKIPVCVEKPFCWSSKQARELMAISNRLETPIYPLYMKPYDTAFQRFKNIIDCDLPLMINITCYAGNNKKWCDNLFNLVKAKNDEKTIIKNNLKQDWKVFLEAKEKNHNFLKCLLQLGIHQINIMHSLLSKVNVINCTYKENNTNLVIHSTLESNDILINYTLIPLFSSPWIWEEKYEAVYPDKIVTYKPSSPFSQVCESTLETIFEKENDLNTEITRCNLKNPFDLMIKDTLNMIINKQSQEPMHAINDILVIEDMFQKI